MAIPIPLSHVLDNPWNTREVYAEDHVAEVADSIRRLGQLQPALGRLVHVVDGKPYPEDVADDLTLISRSAVGDLLRKGARVQLAFGHTRARALASLGSPEIEVTLKRLSDEEMADLAWAENRDRKDLNPVEEARALQRAAETFGYTRDQLAERRGLARPTVSNKLRLLRLPPEVLDLLARGEISEGVARALIPLYDCIAEHREVARDVDVKRYESAAHIAQTAKLKTASAVQREVREYVAVVEREARLRAGEGEPNAEAEAEGREACRSGKAPMDNPHTGADGEAWKAGYFAEMKAMREERAAARAEEPAEAPAVPAAPEAAPPEIEQQAATEAAEEDDYDEPAWYAVERAVRAVLGTVPEPARRLLSNLLIDRERSGDWLGPAWVWGAAMTILREMESAYPSSPREAAEAWGVEVDWSEADVSAETSEHTLIEPSAGARHEVEEGGIPPESVEVSREAVIEEVGAHLAAAREARRPMRQVEKRLAEVAR